MPRKLRDVTFKVVVCQAATESISEVEARLNEAVASMDASVEFLSWAEYEEPEDEPRT